MRIAHLCLSCFYLDGQGYQENELVRLHVDQGNEVLVIASTDSRTNLGEIVYCEPGKYVGNDGARVIRLPYRRFLPRALASKVRTHPGVFDLLREFTPDVILFHGASGYELITVARYVRQNPNVIFYIDSHEDTNNSARTFVSREILHKIFYRFCLSRAWPIACKILAVSTESMDFVHRTYNVPLKNIEFFPLGGTILPDDEYYALRSQTRARLGVAEDEIMFLQAGKQTAAKKLIETLRGFAAATRNAKLFIAGSIDSTIEAEAIALIAGNPSVQFLGWQTPESVKELLCAADVYLQPGTQSVTLQNSLCCRCVPIIADVPAHQVYNEGNGWLVSGDAKLQSAIRAACTSDLSAMSALSHSIAMRLLDYRMLGQRVLR